MEFLNETMSQIKSNPAAIMSITAGKHVKYRLDSLQEQLRRIEYEKAAIEDSAWKNAYSSRLTDDEIIENLEKQGRFDSSEGLIFARQREEIDPRRYEIIHKPLGKWKEVMPVKAFTPGTDRITYRMFDHTGEAELSSTTNRTEVPLVGASAEEFSNKVYNWVLGYDYTAKELRNAAVANVPLATEKLMAVEFGYGTRIQKVMFNGYPEKNLYGMLNHPGVPNTQAAPPASGTDRTWIGGDKTNDEIVREITGAPSRIRERVYGRYGNDVVIGLSQNRFDYIANTRMDTGTDTTIAQFILQNRESNGIQKFVVIHELKTAGTGSTELMIVYPMMSEVIEAQISEQIMWMPMEVRGYSFIFASEMEYGGVVVRYPVAMEQVYGI